MDEAKLEEASLSCDRYDFKIQAAERVVSSSKIEPEGVNIVLEAVTGGISLDPEISPMWKAVALKVQGIALEHL